MGNELKSPCDPPAEPLTRRERQILALLSEGLSGREISEKLVLALSSVKWHIQHIYGKLGVNNRRQALARARELGLLEIVFPASPRPLHNLPVSLTSFVGRVEEIDRARQMLGDPTHRLVTLTGPGGVGKTRLALQVAAASLKAFPQGAWLVELAPLSEPKLVPQAVASVLSVHESAEVPVLVAIQNYLRGKRLLLVLDNCEHLVEACARLVEWLLRSCADLEVLATSREALGVAGEIIYLVPPLSSPDPFHLPQLEHLAQYEAIRLFAERAQAVVPGYRITEKNVAAIARVCRRLDGIPLALELAAARLKMLNIEAINARLDDSFRLLSGGSRAALPRYQTVYASIEWSYSLLSEAERVMFRRLAVFTGGWTLEAADAVCSDEGCGAKEGTGDDDPSSFRLHPSTVLDLLTGLVNKSLVQAQRKQGLETRYGMLEMIRQYGEEKLVEAGEKKALHDSHLAFSLALAVEAEKKLHTAGRLIALDQVETELDNLRAALDWSLRENASENGEAGLKLGCVLVEFWFLFGYSEVKDWLAKGLELIESNPSYDVFRPRVLWAMSQLNKYRYKGYLSKETDQSSALANGDMDPKVWLGLSINKALVSYISGDTRSAQTLATKCIEMARCIGDKWLLADALLWYSVIVVQEKQSEARSYTEESIALFYATGDRWSAAAPLSQLGLIAMAQGDYEMARIYYSRAYELRKEGKDKEGCMWCMIWQASVDFFQKKYSKMRTILESCLITAIEISSLWGAGVVNRRLGIACMYQGDFRRAAKYILDSLTISEERKDIFEDIMAIEGLACMCIAIGQSARGARLLGAVEALVAKNTRRLYVEEQAEFDHWRDEAQVRMDGSAFTAAWNEGRAMILEQALAEAVELGNMALSMTGTGDPPRGR